MKRKDFLKNGLLGVSSIIGISAITGHGVAELHGSLMDDPDCDLSPSKQEDLFPPGLPRS
jgi:hypothetical protein